MLVAAVGATIAETTRQVVTPIWPSWLWAGFLVGAAASAPAVLAPAGFGRLLQPLTVFHPEWVGDRIEKVTAVLARFHAPPGRPRRLLWRRHLRPGHASSSSTSSSRTRCACDMTFWDLAVIVPMSFVVQMLPVSVNGFGIREATFAFYFTRIGQPLEHALLVSLVPTALMMLFSLTGAAVYISRRR